MDKFGASLIVSVWRLVMSLISSVALLKLARRPLFLSSALLVCVSMFSLGLFSYFNIQEEYKEVIATVSWLPLILVLLIYAGAQIGYGPIIKVHSTGWSKKCSRVLDLSITLEHFWGHPI